MKGYGSAISWLAKAVYGGGGDGFNRSCGAAEVAFGMG